ncbi:MAG: hypothetical protein AB1428_14295 [Bacteroidota bacterium]
MRSAAMLLLVLCPLLAAGQEGEFWARASVDSSNYLVGDWITVRVDLRYPRGITLRPDIPDTLEGFHILQRRPLQEVSDTSAQAGVVVARYDSGTAILPPLRYIAVVPGEKGVRTVSTNAVVLTVRTVPVDTTQDIRDVKPPLSIPLTLAEILEIAGIVLLVAAATYGGYRYWKRRKASKGKAEAAYAPPARPAHEIAFEQLALLREKRLWQQGRIKEFYSEVTEVFRRYLENRYAMQAMEETTDEIVEGLRRLRFPDGMLAEAERILRRADLVKFAKYQPALQEHDEMFTVVYHIVDKTKIVAMTPAAAQETHTVAHAGS